VQQAYPQSRRQLDRMVCIKYMPFLHVKKCRRPPGHLMTALSEHLRKNARAQKTLFAILNWQWLADGNDPDIHEVRCVEVLVCAVIVPPDLRKSEQAPKYPAAYGPPSNIGGIRR
jgi:hypothetical protein